MSSIVIVLLSIRILRWLRNQIGSTQGHRSSICSMNLLSSPHMGHIGEIPIFLRKRLAFVARQLLKIEK
ncbi:unnamed protein product [Prunus brigantina]